MSQETSFSPDNHSNHADAIALVNGVLKVTPGKIQALKIGDWVRDTGAERLPGSFPILFGGDGLDPHEMGELQRLAVPAFFQSGQTIFFAGETVDTAYGLSRGIVSHSILLSDGRRQVLGFALPGDFLGIPCADQRTASAQAIGEVAVCRFRRKDLAKFIQASPNMAGLMTRFSTRQLEQAQDQMLLVGRGTAQEKILVFLLRWHDRLALLTGGSSHIVPLPMRRGEIADYLGLTIETVSRTLKKLEQKNVIRVVSNGVELLNMNQTKLGVLQFVGRR